MPRRCLLCGDAAGRCNLCDDCMAGLPVCESACPKCALPMPSPAACGACLRRPPNWDQATAGAWYEFPVDALVGLLKFRGQLAACPALATIMANRPPVGNLEDALLVPVPLHWTRLARRGFNQSVELACTLAGEARWPVDVRSLHRCRRTPPQSGLDRRTRRRNLRGALAWRGASLRGRRVVLIDDVMTTGTTAAACTAVLRDAGAARVDVWVVARAVAP